MRISDWSSDVCSSDLPWHRRKEALDHRARRARAIRVHRDRAADQHAVQRQLTRMIGNQQHRSSRRDIFDPARDDAKVMVVKQLDDTETELGGVLVITPGVITEAADRLARNSAVSGTSGSGRV